MPPSSGSIVNIVHLIHSVGPASFGLGPVALNLAREQALLGNHAEVWSLDGDGDRKWAADSSGVRFESLRGFPSSVPHTLRWSREMERQAHAEAARISVLHLHNLWTGMSRIPNQLRSSHGIATVISPHGALQQWALRKSRWKKAIALALYERNNLHNAACFHAVGEKEIADIRDFGLRQPIAVITNGISTDWLESAGAGAAFRQQFGIAPGRRILLFLSRITPKKGLPLLLEALEFIQPAFPDWCLVIAGADEFGHQAEVEAQIRQRGLVEAVIMPGPLFGQAKRDAFAAAELFVLPSYSEGAPIVILEALGAGVPVLATKASPWPQLVSHGCGWWTEITVDAIVEALREACAQTPDRLKQMGAQGKELVATRFTWRQAAGKTIELYEWLLRKRKKLDFVVLD
jgi:glycosyltransferase involved in cell wall biosynthesis